MPADLPAALPLIATARPRRTCDRKVAFLPQEHGSWSLAFEPIALGLLLAPSRAGAALALAATSGFFLRRPLKAARSHVPSRWLAGLFLGGLAAGLAEAAVLGGITRLAPLLLAAPFGGLFAHFDAQGESRATAAELAGSFAFAFLPAAFATLAGWPIAAAAVLAVLAATRSIPTVLTIRTFLRMRKQRTGGSATPLLAALLGLTALVALAAFGHLPWPATAAAALLAGRTAWLISGRAPAWSAKRTGITEAILGLVCLALNFLAFNLQ